MRKFFLIIIPVFLIFALSVTIFSMATQTTAPKEARETSSVPTAYATGDQSPEAQRTYTNQVTPYPTEQTTNNGTPPAAPLAPQATPAPTAVKPKAVTIAQERCEFWAIRKAAGNGYLLQRIASTNPLNLDDRQLGLWASVLGWEPNCLEYWSRPATTLDLNKRNNVGPPYVHHDYVEYRAHCYYDMYRRAHRLLDEYERKLEATKQHELATPTPTPDQDHLNSFARIYRRLQADTNNTRVKNEDLDPTFARYKPYESTLLRILLEDVNLEDVNLESTSQWDDCQRYYPQYFFDNRWAPLPATG